MKAAHADTSSRPPPLTTAAVNLVATILFVYTSSLVLRHPEPIDLALPMIAIVVAVVAAFTHLSVQCAVPLLMLGEIAIDDERLRLVWFGVVLAIAIGGALLVVARNDRMSFGRAAVITIASIALLRWIPLSNAGVVRETFLLLLATAIVWVIRPTPVSVVIAVAVALFTPAYPMRTFLFPIAVIVAGAALRLARMPRLHGDAVSSLGLAMMLTFFAWSGALARSLPILIHGMRSSERVPVHMALAPGESVVIDVPAGARSLVLSAANASQLRAGTVMGRIEQARTPIVIGDLADWGAMRREQYWSSRNPLPLRPAGRVHDYGQAAWIDGAGHFEVPPNSGTIRVTADRRLPRDTRLQIDGYELGTE